jgi:hypothetical protein
MYSHASSVPWCLIKAAAPPERRSLASGWSGAKNGGHLPEHVLLTLTGRKKLCYSWFNVEPTALYQDFPDKSMKKCCLRRVPVEAQPER